MVMVTRRVMKGTEIERKNVSESNRDTERQREKEYTYIHVFLDDFF